MEKIEPHKGTNVALPAMDDINAIDVDFSCPDSAPPSMHSRKRSMLSAHKHEFWYDLSELENLTEDVNGFKLMGIFMGIYMILLVPYLTLDLSKRVPHKIEQVMLLPIFGLSTFIFFSVILKIDEFSTDTLKRLGIFYILMVIVSIGWDDTMLFIFGSSPPFKMLLYSIFIVPVLFVSLWMLIFKSLNIEWKHYIWTFSCVVSIVILVFTCYGFIFAYYLVEYGLNNKVTKVLLEVIIILLYTIIATLLKIFTPKYINYIQTMKLNKNDCLHNDKVHQYITTIAVVVLILWVQNFYEIVLLPNSSSILITILLMVMDTFSVVLSGIMIFPKARIITNKFITKYKNKIPQYIYKIILLPNEDKVNTFKLALDFGVICLSLLCSNICANMFQITLYYSRNCNLYLISKLSSKELYNGYAVGACDIISVTIMVSIVQYYANTKYNICNPLKLTLLVFEHNKAGIVCSVSSGLAVGLTVLGSNWNAVTFMVDWIQS